MIFDCSEKLSQSTLNILRDFAKISGLYLNYNKTQVVWTGCKKHCDDSFCTDEDLKWGNVF